MKNLLLIIAICSAFIACKKNNKEPVPTPEPEPVPVVYDYYNLSFSMRQFYVSNLAEYQKDTIEFALFINGIKSYMIKGLPTGISDRIFNLSANQLCNASYVWKMLADFKAGDLVEIRFSYLSYKDAAYPQGVVWYINTINKMKKGDLMSNTEIHKSKLDTLKFSKIDGVNVASKSFTYTMP